MTDDAELRARIEAQVAARRAGGSPSQFEPDATDDEINNSDEPSGAERPRGPRSLAPTRPWDRAAAPSSEPPPAPRAEAGRGSGSPALGPVRPWLLQSSGAGDTTPPSAPPDAPPEPKSGLRPALPWAGRPAEPATDSPEPATPAPSNPGIVLRGLSAEADLARAIEADAPARGRRRRANRTPADEPAVVTPPGPAAPAGDAPAPAAYVPDEQTVTAFADAAAAHFDDDGPGDPAGSDEPASPADAEPDQPSVEYPWQRKEEVDLDLHGAPTWDPSMYPPETDVPEGRRGRKALRWLLARSPEPAATDAEPPAPAATEPGPAPTYEPEPVPVAEAEPTPVAEAEPPVEAELVAEPAPAYEPDPIVLEAPPVPAADDVHADPTDSPAPGADLARRLAAATAADRPDAAPDPTGEPARAGLGRLFGRRRRAEADDADEAHEQFELPAPDASFEQPWLRSEPMLRPTRNWTPSEATPRTDPVREVLPGGGAEGAEPDADSARHAAATAPLFAPTAAEPEPVLAPEPPPAPEPQPVAEATSEPEPEPVPDVAPAPQPEPVAEAIPEPEPEPVAEVVEVVPAPEPARPARRPSPGSARRPSPGAVPAAEPTASRPAPRPRPTPRPAAAPAVDLSKNQPGPAPRAGISGVTTDSSTAFGASRRPTPFEAAGAGGATAFGGRPSTTATAAGHQPDLSRFLEATEPRPGDDVDGDTPEKRKPGGGGRWRRFLIRGFIIVAIAAVAAFLLRAFVVQPYYIPSESMEPTLHGCTGCSDDHVLVDKISYRAHDVREGDIVVFDRPPSVHVGEKVLIKRVVGLAGDVVQLKNGEVFVNGLQLDEPYINKNCGTHPTQPLTSTTRWKVPGNDVFVMGDNRCNSDDSREFGPIPTSTIVGRAFAIIWPLGRARLL